MQPHGENKTKSPRLRIIADARHGNVSAIAVTAVVDGELQTVAFDTTGDAQLRALLAGGLMQQVARLATV